MLIRWLLNFTKVCRHFGRKTNHVIRGLELSVLPLPLPGRRESRTRG